MKKGRGGGKEREAPTHLIKNSKRSHAGRVTKNKNERGCGYVVRAAQSQSSTGLRPYV